MTSIDAIHQSRIDALLGDLEKARQVQNELTAALVSAKATIAQMEQARRERDDRWALLLGETKLNFDSLKLEVKSLRNPNTQPQQPDIQP